MCWETVELVMFLPWNLLPLPWKLVSFLLELQFCFPWLPRLPIRICFCHFLLSCCCWNEGPNLKGFVLLSSFRKASIDFFFDFTDSVKWSLNSFPKIFSSIVCGNSTLLFQMFFAYRGEHTLERMLYLRRYEIGLLVWPSKQMVCSTRIRIPSRDKGGASDFLAVSNLTILWIKDPSWRKLFYVFFPESHP